VELPPLESGREIASDPLALPVVVLHRAVEHLDALARVCGADGGCGGVPCGSS
jgi:hypothetical protein